MMSLKITEGQSRSVNQRRADPTMTKRKKTKEQAKVYNSLHRKDRAIQIPLNTGMVSSSCSISGTRRGNHRSRNN
jgi:hypothetical protein